MRTDWEERYRTGRTGWDQGRAAPVVGEAVSFFGAAERILVPGCGLGHDAAALAGALPVVEGWDVAPSAVRGAEERYGAPGLRFRRIDLVNGPVPPGRFDGIFEHTFLCAVGPSFWERVVRRYADLLREDGRLFAILFTNLVEDDPPPWGISETGAEELFAPWFEIMEKAPPAESFPHREGEETVWKLRKRRDQGLSPKLSNCQESLPPAFLI